MSNEANLTGIKLSIVDRIIGSGRSNSVRASHTASVRELEDTLHRDLTALLNTRRPETPIPSEFTEATTSLATFGLPDFTGCSALDRAEQERFRRAIETAIRFFEPRLSNVTVSLDIPRKRDGQPRPAEASLRYHVRALLRLDPEPEPVVFDAVLEPGSGRIAVEMTNQTRNVDHAG